VLAVHDVDPAAAARAAALVGAADAVVASAAAAVETAGVELVVVATNHVGLAPATLTALRAGRHVLVEKPAASTLAAAEEVAAAAVEHGRVVRVGYNHRFHPALLQLRELVAGGSCGPLLHVRGRYGHGGRLGYEAEWRAQRAISGGGELLDQGSHLIDLVRVLAGDVELAFAELRTSFWPMEVEDNAFLALRTAGDGFAWLHASWSEWKNMFSLEVTLRDAKLEVTGLGGSYGPERLTHYAMGPELGPPDITTWEWPPGDDSWSREVADVLTAIAGGAAVGASIDDAVAALRVVDEAYRR
jgi:predicted dehydrogenase